MTVSSKQAELAEIEEKETFIVFELKRVDAYEQMLEDTKDIYAKYQKLQKVFERFQEAFPEDEKFRQNAEQNLVAMKKMAETIDYGTQTAQKHRYHLEEFRGYLQHRKAELLEGDEADLS